MLFIGGGGETAGLRLQIVILPALAGCNNEYSPAPTRASPTLSTASHDEITRQCSVDQNGVAIKLVVGRLACVWGENNNCKGQGGRRVAKSFKAEVCLWYTCSGSSVDHVSNKCFTMWKRFGAVYSFAEVELC